MSGPPLDPARALPRVQRPGGSRASAPRGPRGAISWVTLVFLGAVAGGGYLAWVWVPVYAEAYAVRQVVRDYLNQAIKNPDDDALRRDMVSKIRSLGVIEALDADGRAVRRPAVALEEGDVAWNRDLGSQPPMLRVSFAYAREVALPVLDRTTSKIFSIDESNELSVPNWGPVR